MTSPQSKSLGFHQGERTKSFEKIAETVKEEIGRVFNPEFLNRLDDTIVFHPLERDHIVQIMAILLKELERRVGDQIKLTPAATDFLVDQGYDQNYGARPLKRAIQKYLEDPLSERLLAGDLARTDEIEVDVAPEGDKLVFRALSGSHA